MKKPTQPYQAGLAELTPVNDAAPTPEYKPRLYSYLRWSSAKQAAGTSLERQTKAAREYAAEHGYEYVEPFTDAGVSAFKSRNQTSGQLGVFIDLVEQGVIPAGSALFIESMDRLSRSEITTANKLFLELLDLGLTLITGMDGKVYSRESVNKNPTDLMLSILLFMRANEESATKSRRVRGNGLALVERFKRGERVNIKSMSNTPWWIDSSGKTVEKHPLHWTAARKACDLLLQGWGVFKITGYLNDRREIYPAPLGNKRKADGQRLAVWTIPIIRALQVRNVPNNDPANKTRGGKIKKSIMAPNKAILGELTLHIDGVAHELVDYYPALVTQTEFAKIHQIRTDNKISYGEERNAISLLSGLRVLKCGHCGGGMSYFACSSKVGGGCRRIRYNCILARSEPDRCTQWSVKGALVEGTCIRALMYGYVHDAVLNGVPVQDLTPQIEAGRVRLDSIKSQIDNYTAAIGLGGNLETLVSSIKRLEEEKANTLLELDRLQQQQALAGSEEDTHKRLVEVVRLLTPALLNDPTHPDRVAVRELCRKVFQRVVITRQLDKSITIAYTYPDNSQCIFEGVWLPAAKKGGKPTRGFTVYTLSPDGERHDDMYGQISQLVSTDEMPIEIKAPGAAAVERLAIRLGHQPMQGRDFFTLRNQ